MDGAGPRPAGELTEQTAADVSLHPPWWRVVLLLVPPVLLAGLLAGIALFALRLHAADARDDRRSAVLAAARAEALNLTTISYQTAERDLDRIVAAATGQVRTQFLAQRKQFPDVLRKAKSTSVGSILASALVSLHGSTARALVAVDATVNNAQTAAAKAAPQVKHYRMAMTLQHIKGNWLVSDVAFAGLPQ